MPPALKIGDLVEPRPEWRDAPNCVPTGRVRAIAPWGEEGALYVGTDHRAFAAYVFQLTMPA
ncbi:MAG TPA: hypothetical protein VGH29_04800 [Candidatus Binataceae bacterium]|jgi:hypothetical protein